MYVIIYNLVFGGYHYKECKTKQEIEKILSNKNANIEKIYEIKKELILTIKD